MVDLIHEHMTDIVQGPLILDLLCHIFQDGCNLDQVNGLADKKIHPGRVGLADQLLGGHLGDHNTFDRGVHSPQLLYKFNAVLYRHEKVDEDNIRLCPQHVGQVCWLSAAIAADFSESLCLDDVF